MMPTLTVIASATPTSTGGIVTATVAGGSGAYAYAWTCSPPALTINNFTGAMPTFTARAAGTYTATVRVTDINGGAVASTAATFAVPQVLAQIGMSPATVAVGCPQQIATTLLDQFGSPFAGVVALEWAATSGTVTNAGVYTAATAGSATVTASGGNASGSVGVTVVQAATLGLVWPERLAPGVTQTVTFGYFPTVPIGASIGASAGTMSGAQAISGTMLSASYTAPASGTVTFTDVIAGVSVAATVGATAVPMRHLSVLFSYKHTPGCVRLPSDPDDRRLLFGAGPSGAGSVVELDTGFPVGPPSGTPFIRAGVGGFYFDVPDVAPAAAFRFFYRVRFDGCLSEGSFFALPANSGPTPPPNALTGALAQCVPGPSSHAVVVAGSSLTLLARALGTDGNPLAPGAVASVAITVTDVPDDAVTFGASPPVASVVSATLQTGPQWTEDATGYNVTVVLPPTAFPTADRTYIVDAAFTTTGAAVIKAVWNLQSLPS